MGTKSSRGGRGPGARARDQRPDRSAAGNGLSEPLEERARFYLEMAGVMMLALDPDGRVSMINRRGGEILGMSPEKIIGLDWFDHFIPEDQRSGVRKVFARIMAGELEADAYLENRVLTAGGEERFIAWHNTVIHDVHGAIIGTLSSGEDITRKRQVEEDRALLARLLDISPVSITVHDFKGRFLYANARTLEIHGMSEKEFLERGLVGVDDAETYAGIEERYERIRRDGHAEFEAVHLRGDGTPVPMLVNASVASWKGRPVILSVAVDLSERREAEEALRESQQLYQTFINATRDLVFVKDEDFRYIVANDAVMKFFGRSLEELRQCTDFDLMDPVAAEKCRESDRRALESGAPIVAEETVNHRVFESTKFPLILKGGRVGIGAIIRDITERRQAEEEREHLREQVMQAQKMESVGRLAGGVAHDFNNILSVIMGHAELALDKVDPADPLHEDLGEIRRAARRSAELTRQLLAFARRQTVLPRVLDMNETVEGMIKMLERLIGENIELIWQPGERIWPVRIDPAQLDQILANLCVNARDAISGNGRISISTQNLTVDDEYLNRHAGFQPGKYVCLTVSDDGCGMDRETLEKIFEPFFTTKDVGEGTGLGLSTVYGIVRQNGGFIHAYSEAGHGTTFRIYLPRHIGEEGVARPDSGPRSVKGGGEMVLLVEDEAAILKLAQRMLRGLGYQVLSAATPEEALKTAAEYAGEIHLLLSDVIMPGMNGSELAARITRERPEMKILFMSGYTADVIAHQNILSEDVHFMQKPFTIRELAAQIRDALDG